VRQRGVEVVDGQGDAELVDLAHLLSVARRRQSLPVPV
jgi:hypothetical protein